MSFGLAERWHQTSKHTKPVIYNMHTQPPCTQPPTSTVESVQVRPTRTITDQYLQTRRSVVVLKCASILKCQNHTYLSSSGGVVWSRDWGSLVTWYYLICKWNGSSNTASDINGTACAVKRVIYNRLAHRSHLTTQHIGLRDGQTTSTLYRYRLMSCKM